VQGEAKTEIKDRRENSPVEVEAPFGEGWIAGLRSLVVCSAQGFTLL
jgi:hypothetical protein